MTETNKTISLAELEADGFIVGAGAPPIPPSGDPATRTILLDTVAHLRAAAGARGAVQLPHAACVALLHRLDQLTEMERRAEAMQRGAAAGSRTSARYILGDPS